MAKFKNNNLLLLDDETVSLGDAAEATIKYDNGTSTLDLGVVGTGISITDTGADGALTLKADTTTVAIFNTTSTLRIGSGAGATWGGGGFGCNTCLGYLAGNSYIGAAYNTFVGSNAGQATTSSNCTMVGYAAGQNATGGGTTALGYQAARAITGLYNTALGIEAIGVGAAGNYNVAVGYRAGQNITGAQNVCVGYLAGDSITSGSRNIIVGDSADTAAANNDKLVIGNTTSTMFSGDMSAKTLSINAQITIGAGVLPYSLPNTDGTIGQVLATNGAGVISFTALPTHTHDKIEELNTSVETIDTGTDGRIVFTADGSFVGQVDDTTIVRYGYLAGQTAAGLNTTCIGSNAGKTLSSGAGNTCIGSEAGESIATQFNNTLIGFQAGETSTGDYNTFVGYQAGRTTSNGYAVCIGHRSGYNAVIGAGSVFIGSQAGAAATGNYNLLLGYTAGDALSSGTYNVGVGYAVFGLTTGSYNVGIGSNALDALTSGGSNVALGPSAMGTMSTGSYNIAIGSSAMNGGTNANTPSNNICLGNTAGTGIDASYNVCMGGYNLISAITVGKNIVIGYQAGNRVTSASNIAIGYQALGRAIAHASTENVCIGETCGVAISGATGNTGVGTYALNAVTTGGGNVALGYQAGDGVSTGTYNTMLGSRAGRTNVTDSYNIFIGNEAAPAAAYGSGSKLYIHSAAAGTTYPLIYGEFDTRVVRFHGAVTFSDSTNSDGFTFPIVDGAANQTLVTNGAGAVSWGSAPGTFTSAENLDIDIGTEDVDTFDPTADGGVVWHYFVSDGTNMRTGTVQAVWDDSAGTAQYTETVTNDIGTTAGVTIAVDMSGAAGNVRLRATVTTDNWLMRVKRIAF